MATMQSAPLFLNVLNSRIGLDVAVYLIGKARCVQQVRHLFGYIESNKVRVRAHKSLLKAACRQLGDDVPNRALAVIGYRIQYDAVCHK